MRIRRSGKIGAYGWLGLLLTALACGDPAPKEESIRSGADPKPASAVDSIAPAPAEDAARACDGQRGAALEEPLELPGDLRFVARIDLRDADVPVALGHLESWARDDADRSATTATAERAAPPIVVGLALSQVGFQVTHLRGILGTVGMDPPEVLLLQGPDGDLVWIWRLPCDLDRLRTLLADGFGLRMRTLVSGVIGEPVDAARFPFDLLVLPGDRLALVPAGKGRRALRWLRGEAPRVPGLGAEEPVEEHPQALLSGLDPAPVRLVIAGRVGGALTLRPGSTVATTMLVRVDAAGLQISGSLPPGP
ncbi:MAG TPA: hypothetical protein ENJ18_10310 [Nannocystis exedens]|nr:hypothetical protein [Nannocystis exedens]